MPVSLTLPQLTDNPQACTSKLCDKPSADCVDRASRQLTIGLINNMSDGALEATERQFVSLLESASDGMSIRLLRYSLPGINRGEAAARHVAGNYQGTTQLSETQLDGLIVTGREPLTANLEDEPYWDSFRWVLNWAQYNATSSIWSCLAAHAAVLAMDGIRRVKSERKHSGIYNCERVLDHQLVTSTPPDFRLPHSRWNGLPEEDLERHGYRVLTRTIGAGVDTFVRQNGGLFIFFQGHPEYEGHTLLLEYRRDVARYLRGETASYPSIPCGYFDGETSDALANFAREAQLSRREALMGAVASVLDRAVVVNSWRSTSNFLYRNWLDYLCAQKRQRLQGSISQEAIRLSDAREAVSADRFPPPAAHGPGSQSGIASAASRPALTIL
ncbi:MAG TPA: homoserine O-succinyltransferase [Acidobacteriaceae bacterium]|nr:homoserine O-succinyltransferase [Acidobacteriaceae bacterium]